MNNDLVSIIVPVYNRAHTLERLFSSLKAQTYRPLEIILVDNNSSDASLAVCREFATVESAPDFSIVVGAEKTPGASAARNCGLRLAHADRVSFFDSDDEMSPDFIEAMCQAWEHNPEADFVAARSLMVFEDGREKVREGLDCLSLHSHILSGALSTQSFLLCTDFAKRIGGWCETVLFWDDYELGIRMLQHARSFVTLPRTFHRIYQHAQSLTGESLGATFEKIRAVVPQIEQQVLHPQEGHATRKSQKALYFRLCILAGKLYEERHREGALWLRSRAFRVAQETKLGAFTRLVGRLLQMYTQIGGRGAWRIAIFALGN